MLLRQSEARRDPSVVAEQLADEIRAVALLAPMQQDNVVWQSAGAVEEFAYGCKGLEVGKVATAAHCASDRPLDQTRSGWVGCAAPGGRKPG